MLSSLFGGVPGFGASQIGPPPVGATSGDAANRSINVIGTAGGSLTDIARFIQDVNYAPANGGYAGSLTRASYMRPFEPEPPVRSNPAMGWAIVGGLALVAILILRRG